jgi:hypothetical protein
MKESKRYLPHFCDAFCCLLAGGEPGGGRHRQGGATAAPLLDSEFTTMKQLKQYLPHLCDALLLLLQVVSQVEAATGKVVLLLHPFWV